MWSCSIHVLEIRQEISQYTCIPQHNFQLNLQEVSTSQSLSHFIFKFVEIFKSASLLLHLLSSLVCLMDYWIIIVIHIH